ncbi:MAG TPA: oligosaccharide flippase family protein [Ruminiclostridium sp.]|nr:oligosaccharide flippase family protein [Ruminiclostridium sp.]
MTLAQDFVVNIKQKINSLLRNQDIKNFIGNLGIVFVFRFLTAVLSVISLVLAARYLGAVSVGNITMIQNTAYLLYIPMCFGVNSSIIKYLPFCNEGESDELLGSVCVWNLALTVLFSVFYWLFHSYFNSFLGFSSMQLLLTVLMAVMINFSMITDAILRTKKRFFTLGSIKMAGSLVFFTFTIISSVIMKNYIYFVVGIIVNQFIVVIWSISTIKFKKIRFSIKTSKIIYKYGGINTVSSVLCYIMFSSDLYIVNHFCSSYDVGIYSLYQVNVKNFFNMMFHEIFAVVFLPTIVKMDTMRLYKRVRSLLPVLLPLAVLANIALSVSMLLMYGKSYTINWVYVLLISTALGFHFVYWVLNSVFTVEGKKGALVCLAGLGIPMPVLIFLSITFTRLWGITGLLVSSLITQIVLIGMFILIIKYKHLNTKSGSFEDAGILEK